jgi:DNA primase
MEFYLQELLKRSDLNSPEGKSRFFEETLKYLKKINNVVETGHYTAMLATMLDISTDAVYEALRASRGKGAKAGGKEGRPSGALKGLMATRSSNLRELTVLKVILRHPELFSPRVEEAVGRFRDLALREAGRYISVCLKEGRTLDFAALVEGLSDERLKGVVAGMLFKEDDGFIENPEKMLDDSLRKVLNRGKLKETTEHMIERLEASGRKEMAEKVRERAMRRPLNK